MESVPVRCPACRRDHVYVTAAYPCPCGAPTAPPLLRGAAVTAITHRTWNDDWVTVRCRACGRHDQWPQPELCCPCGAVLRIPVRPVASLGRTPDGGPHPGDPPVRPSHIPLPRTASAPRPAFRPLTIRTARDAVGAAALYLKWLGYHEVVQPAERPSSRIDLRAAGLIAQVDSTTRTTALRDVECLWLNALSTSVSAVFFSLAGYAPDARERADGLAIPLFVMDLTGTPQPVNSPADELVSTGA
ncbi:hypothetical protein AMK09_13910 [Streptomyces sp. CB02488]|uniref:hypothetical protein n=1 Tax=unclassified Streptomyces TaxID=2593676 RepID=UPI00093D23E0|nr:MULTISPECIES: hypothetical protein [unclassified Streptomyces]OKK21558.1 hypothetical protein AMK09_13910 [Streptomyces sp. CB02488]